MPITHNKIKVRNIFCIKHDPKIIEKDQFKYEQATPLELHELVKTLLVCSKNSSPYFPPTFSKKLCESQGLQCNENVFFNLISNIVDFKLEECINQIKENTIAGSSKKQVKDLTLKTVDVQKYFLEKEVKFGRARVYPQMEINSNIDDTLMPEIEDRKNQKA